jgi:hypothetical protein
MNFRSSDGVSRESRAAENRIGPSEFAAKAADKKSNIGQ